MIHAPTHGYQCLEVLSDGPVLEVWLNRPEVLNAFNPLTIAELTHLFSSLTDPLSPRVVILGGRGKLFCSGGDIEWMRSMASYTDAQNLEDAKRLAEMLRAVHSCPCPLLGRVQGGAYGGALGLLACCDTVVSADDAHFSFGEVRIGLAPATIAPFVVEKIGLSRALDLMLSGEKFNTAQAIDSGLLHFAVRPAKLDEAIDAKLEELLKAGPLAARATKHLLRRFSAAPSRDVAEYTAKIIAELRVSPEGQEGLNAFRERRPPNWEL